MTRPHLSIIVPLYNEREQLTPFLQMLLRQQGIAFELILCDGGSSDGSVALAHELIRAVPFAAQVVDCPKGRGPQMNAGAAVALAETLLFLHIDSRFPDPTALAAALQQLERARQRHLAPVAGHFSLRFYDRGPIADASFYHLECKARLDRDGCTHGDQGFMLAATDFARVGPFDDWFPYAEDTRLADRLRRRGEWLLFPQAIETSARRFVSEGLRERQTFNAILMNVAAVDWREFIEQAAGLYATQDQTGRLQLSVYYRLIHRLLQQMPVRQKLRFWSATGAFVRFNAWQIPFYSDTQQLFRDGAAVGSGPYRRLEWYDSWCEPLLDNRIGRILAALLTWLWFQVIRRSAEAT